MGPIFTRSVGVPRPAQRDRRLAEEGVDVDRLVGLPGPALLGLLDEAHDRREALRERGLVRCGRARTTHDDEREPGEDAEEREAEPSGPGRHGALFDATAGIPLRLVSTCPRGEASSTAARAQAP